ncbi:MAG: rhombosortase [Nibricoccus sp.]
MKKAPVITFAVACVALCVHLLPGLGTELEMSRSGLREGEIWRLLTGHLTHFTTEHLKWDLVVFGALGSLVELRNRRHFLSILAGSAVAISLAVIWFQPQFTTYRGLSGVDCALYGYIAMDILILSLLERRRGPALVAGAACVFLVAKVVFEMVTGRAFFVDSAASFTPVPLAHLVGACVGAGRALLSGRSLAGRSKLRFSKSVVQA